MDQKISGFSLIELMISLSVVGILTAIAVPAYRDYTYRSKVDELMSYAGASSMQVASYIAEQQPASLTGACSTIPTKNGSPNTSITKKWQVGNSCTVAVTSQAIFPGSPPGTVIITLSPTLELGSSTLSWTCSSGSSPYAPASCQ